MALSEIDYTARVKEAGANIYTVVEADADGNCRVENVNPANPMFNNYSIAKAYTVFAVGLCADRGLLTPETRLCDVLGKYLPANADEKWQRVTLDMVMRHRTGYSAGGYLDIDAQDAAAWPSTDYLRLCFDGELTYEPGEVYKYTDADFYLMSRVVSEVTGKSLCDFLRPALMETMGFSELAWSTCPQGYSMGATGLYLRTKDMVKLGVLWLRGGDWFGKRLVSEDWVQKVLDRGYEFTLKTETADGKWYGKGGMRGQMLTFNPSQGLAVAWNAYGKVPYDEIIK